MLLGEKAGGEGSSRLEAMLGALTALQWLGPRLGSLGAMRGCGAGEEPGKEALKEVEACPVNTWDPGIL